MQSNLAASPIGIAKLSKLAFDGADLKPLWRGLVDRFIADQDAAAALMDLATIEQFLGDNESGLARQREALSLVRLYRSPVTGSPSRRLLALAAAGDIGTNTPLEFLLDGSDIALETLYVVPGLPLPDPLPEFDIAIIAVGESDENRPALASIADITKGWRQPVLNAPAQIVELARDRLAARMQKIAGLVMPPTLRVERAALARLARGESELCSFPLIARPVDSHAGRGLAKLADGAALARYLAERPERRFFVSPFIDYAGADGFFRKYRIAFIDGRPYPCHMAIADQWMIYYLNAGMRDAPWKRAEEAHFMASFDADFAQRHAAALGEIAARVGLDYFAIDCAQTPDGALLLFEADIAMIVHDMDPPDIFPYKGPQMQKLFAAFRALVKRKAPT
jgi:glutathione synthase/RimK-type ligase-like ATP-grasp enzyme